MQEAWYLCRHHVNNLDGRSAAPRRRNQAGSRVRWGQIMKASGQTVVFGGLQVEVNYGRIGTMERCLCQSEEWSEEGRLEAGPI